MTAAVTSNRCHELQVKDQYDLSLELPSRLSSVKPKPLYHQYRIETCCPALQEPALYRLYEAIIHSGDAVKALINEEFGDGIMSAIDFYCTLDKMKGNEGESRVVITFNGE